MWSQAARVLVLVVVFVACGDDAGVDSGRDVGDAPGDASVDAPGDVSADASEDVAGAADASADESDVSVDSFSDTDATTEDTDSDLPGLEGRCGPRGPSGQWPAHTPTYDTPADIVLSDDDDLQDAIDRASSGTVIELAADIVGLTLRGGDAAWDQNVLIRPPLGQRADFVFRERTELRASHVTIAGFGSAGSANVYSPSVRSGFAWIECSANAYFQIASRNDGEVIDGFLYEIVATDWKVGGDRMQIKSWGYDNVRPLLVGMYLVGSTRETGGDDHCDTMQTFQQAGGRTIEWTVRDSIVFSAHDKALQGDAQNTDMLISNTTMYEQSTSQPFMPPVPPGTEEPAGFHVITGGMASGTLVCADIVGSLGSTVAVARNTNVHSEPAIDQIEEREDVTFVEGTLAPPVLPEDMTHERLDRLWAL